MEAAFISQLLPPQLREYRSPRSSHHFSLSLASQHQNGGRQDEDLRPEQMESDEVPLGPLQSCLD